MFVKQILVQRAFLVLLVIVVTGCGQASTQPPMAQPSDPPLTQVAKTVIAKWTMQAASFTHTPLPPTDTPRSTEAHEASPEPGRTDVPVPTLSPKPTTGGILLYRDDFESLVGWYTQEADNFTLAFSEGGYRMVVNMVTGSAPVYSVRQQTYTDIRIEVDIMQVQGPSDGYFGLVCRFVDSTNYYRFVMGRDGYYDIAKKVNGEFSYLSSGSQKDLFITDGTANHLRADCVGGALTLYINGEKMLEVQDGGLTNGSVGLVVGTNSEPGMDALFDNFLILEP